MMKNYILLMLLFIGFTSATFAQEVSGTVIEGESSQPLPGVSVIVKGTTTGTTTDFDGNYTISANNGDVLVFSYVGFDTQEVTVSSSVIDVTMKSGVALEEVVLVGTRNKSRTAVDTAVPIDVIDVTELASAGPQVSVTQILNYVAPSFSSNTQTVADGTDHIDPAQLRGLGPDQVLVLVNGKRRHTSSLVNVNGTPGRGSVGTDLNAIPAAAIKRIEVLRDGAAAQYGSDAIAGVINIVLKNSVNELTATVTSGANFSKNGNDHSGDVDGEKHQIDLNYGIPLGDNGGFVNFTGSLTTRNRTSRAGTREGQLFNAYNAVEWQAAQDGFNLTTLRTDLDAIKRYAAMVPHFDAALQAQIAGASSIYELSGYDPTIVGTDGKPIVDLNAILRGGQARGIDVTDAELAVRGLTRDDFNMSVGQSGLDQGQFMGNLEIPLDDNDTKLYAFGGLSYRHGDASGFYREPYRPRGNTLQTINGFLPNIESDIIDKSLAFGISGKIGEWDIDFSNTWGQNTFAYTITNTTNFYLQASSPREFDAGLNGFQQNTVNLDITRFYEDIFSGLNIAFGAEYRLENYFIEAGEESSYARYDINGEVETAAAAATPTLQVTDFYGNQATAGAQVFPGFTPENAIDAKRNSMALYADVEADLSEDFLISAALRFEDFSDFGNTLNGKLAMRYKLGDNTNLRGAFSTGFRAPSLHQQFYSKSNTLFNDQGVAQEVGTFTNNSIAANLFGIPQLKEETSLNASLGFTTKIPNANLTFTVDGFFIGINDRITYTGNFKNPNDGSQLADIFDNLGINEAAFFANAIDTETFGVDVVVTNKRDIGKGKLTSNLAFTYAKTKQVGGIQGSQILTDAGLLDTYFDEASRVYLELAVPRVKANLSNTYELGKWSFFLRNAFFGSVFDTGNLQDTSGNVIIDSDGNPEHPEIGANFVTDLTIGYTFSDNFRLTIGANNLFDVYPDELPSYLTVNNQFVYSRRVSQFGNNGRYLFARLNFNIK